MDAYGVGMNSRGRVSAPGWCGDGYDLLPGLPIAGVRMRSPSVRSGVKRMDLGVDLSIVRG